MLPTVAQVTNRKFDVIVLNLDAKQEHTLQVGNVRFLQIDQTQPPPATEPSDPVTDDELHITRNRVDDILEKVCPSAKSINQRRGMAFETSSRNI